MWYKNLIILNFELWYFYSHIKKKFQILDSYWKCRRCGVFSRLEMQSQSTWGRCDRGPWGVGGPVEGQTSECVGWETGLEMHVVGAFHLKQRWLSSLHVAPKDFPRFIHSLVRQFGLDLFTTTMLVLIIYI